MSVLSGIVGFIVMLGLLIFIHEGGHFLAAKAFGVRVLVFSLGFVGRIVSFRWGETTYQIGWLPLGGYVKMLGESDIDAEQITPEEQNCAFSYKPLWQRAIIVLAGPLSNLLIMPLFIFFVLNYAQKTEVSTVIGMVVAKSPAAQAGLKQGDQIVAVNGERTRYFSDLLDLIGNAEQEKLILQVRRGKKLLTIPVKTKVKEFKDRLGNLQSRRIIGVGVDFRPPVIGVEDPRSPAWKAGLRTWDRIIRVNGQPITRWAQIVELQKKNPAGPHHYTFRRKIRYKNPLFQFEYPLPPQQTTVYPQRVPRGERVEYVDGIEAAELYVRQVHRGTPLAEAGVRPGDRLVRVGQKKLVLRSDLSELPRTPKRQYQLTLRRAGKSYTLPFRLQAMTWTDRLNQKHEVYPLGVVVGVPYSKGVRIPIKRRWLYALTHSWRDTWELTGMMFVVFKMLFTRKLSVKTLGGPILIFQIAQDAVKSGWKIFLRQLALISINLGLLNLLPIPVLDGGHLLFFLIEGIIRRPLPRRLKEGALFLGLAFLLFLMIFALTNDLQRIFQ